MDPADLLKLENFNPQEMDEKIRNEAKNKQINHNSGTSKEEDIPIDVDGYGEDGFEITAENWRSLVDASSLKYFDEFDKECDRVVNDFPSVENPKNKAYVILNDPKIFDKNIVTEEDFLDSERDTDDEEEWTDEEVLNYDWTLVKN